MHLDATIDGPAPKFLTVIAVYSCLCMANRVGRRCTTTDVVAALAELTSVYPVPKFIGSDNGSELIAQALWDWCEANDTTSTAYIEPGSLWENNFAESFKGCFCDESHSNQLFNTALEAHLLADCWRWEYTHVQDTFGPPGAPVEAPQAGAAP